MDYDSVIKLPISDDMICGENMEDDSGFQSFFFAAEGTPERYDGQTTSPAEPPDWREIKKQALEYLGQTKDVKLISVLCQAVLNTEGLLKFEECLRGLSALISENWVEFYPPLDEDDGDPLERLSALGHLTEGYITTTLKTTPLASVKGLGQVTLQSIDKGIAGSSDDALSLSQIKGIFSEVDSSENLALYTAINHCKTHLNDINQVFIEQAGHEYGVNFDPTLDVLGQLALAYENHANLQMVAEEANSEDADVADHEDSEEGIMVSSNGGGRSVNTFDANGKLGSRKDVEKCFKMILEYYAQHEPSSPIPILVQRANKLVHLDFLAIMKDIYPDALSSLHQLGGITEEDTTESGSSSTDDSW
jgi:type VI secretion system protein ImpA